MSEDISNKIQQLKDMLDNGGAADNLKETLNNGNFENNLKNIMSMLGNQSNQKNSQKSENIFGDMDQIKLFKKLSKLMNNKNQINDPRTNLLNALKPYVSQKRQQRIDSCHQILQFTSLSELLREED